MSINIDKLIDYYAQGNFVYKNAFFDSVPPHSVGYGQTTNDEACGIVVPLAGSACFRLAGTPYLLKPGVVIHAPPGIPLAKEVVGNKEWRYALIHFQLSEKEASSLPFYTAHFNVQVGNSSKIFNMARQLCLNFSETSSTAFLRSKSMFHNILEEIALSAQRQYRNGGGLIEDATAYMRENYSRQFSIAELAALYGMEGRRFAELFQKHVGRTPIQYLTSLRIDRSKELLKIPGNTVTQVSEYVGYTDTYYFSRLFKQITGLSPMEFQVTAGKIHP